MEGQPGWVNLVFFGVAQIPRPPTWEAVFTTDKVCKTLGLSHMTSLGSTKLYLLVLSADTRVSNDKYPTQIGILRREERQRDFFSLNNKKGPLGLKV